MEGEEERGGGVAAERRREVDHQINDFESEKRNCKFWINKIELQIEQQIENQGETKNSILQQYEAERKEEAVPRRRGDERSSRAQDGNKGGFGGGQETTRSNAE